MLRALPEHSHSCIDCVLRIGHWFCRESAMDNVLVQRGARAFQLSYSHSYYPTLRSMAASNAIPNLRKSLFMTWDGLKKRGMKQKQTHITVAYYIKDIPARDSIIHFGKYEGRMLGTLPSKYLRWMMKKRYPDAEWSAMAEEVLEDPVYRDRMEWEALDEAMKGSGKLLTKRSSTPYITDFHRFSARFGWDPWGDWDIDYNLLGTSKGKRIPRIKDNPRHEHLLNLVMQKKGMMTTSLREALLSENAEDKLDHKSNGNGSTELKSEIEMRRDARRERQRLRKGPVKSQLKQQPGEGRLFPGRGALLRRIDDAESRETQLKQQPGDGRLFYGRGALLRRINDAESRD
ncbi:hypothetical protein SUGI_0001530 [Cryptomeria japonica]|uniref:uncharacterized protein LOC131036679 n=1 Tax=Cryptomeria japonica TaxID=3369 RepID=UPI002408D6AD|nr:uncharacterized protein LOC131036679 [Cryptomeria japonica]GLJ04700.1 hypothetical protein SUGI_0001530 [Cryptomeria japonica]